MVSKTKITKKDETKKSSTFSVKKLTAKAAAAGADGASNKAKHPLFLSTPKNFGIGQCIRPRTDLSRYVKWPQYVQLQRKRAILLQRLKVPPSVNQFRCPADRNQSSQLFRLLRKYKPENKVERKERLRAEAERLAKGGDEPAAAKRASLALATGVNRVTSLIESKRARLVVIAHDVTPLELVLWMPALCRKKDVPYCIVKSKSRLGELAARKTCCCVALENVRKEDQNELDTLIKLFRAEFNDNVELRRRWGGGILGMKSRHAIEKQARIVAREQAKKLGA